MQLERKREMDQQLLKKLLLWISTHELSSYNSENLKRDLNIDIPPLSTPFLVVEAILCTALTSAQAKTTLIYPSTQDELFDLILTFFEELSDYKSEFEKIFSPKTTTLEYFNFLPLIKKLVTKIFHNYIHTSLDKLTYGVIFFKLFYIWLTDNTPDFSFTSHQINRLAEIIYQQS